MREGQIHISLYKSRVVGEGSDWVEYLYWFLVVQDGEYAMVKLLSPRKDDRALRDEVKSIVRLEGYKLFWRPVTEAIQSELPTLARISR